MGSTIPCWTFGPDGEGRINTVSSSITSQQNPVTATSYNGFSEATGITLGSSDADAFQYDANTGRMTQYKASVNSTSMTGTLTWNSNWTLGTLAISDSLNSADTQTCTYGYDALSRLTSSGCGSVWSQTFSYDAFGNIAKSGSQSFGPTYSASTNRYTAIGSVTPTYDSNGNLTYDGFYNYTWDGEGNMASLGGNAETYDALDRRVEQYNGSAYTEIVYGPAGNKLALMSGQTVTKVFTPLSGGATAVYNSSGLAYYRHPDWLGSSRVASTPSRTLYYDGAYAPFGENYAGTGTTDLNFTGQNQDLTANLYDFLYREMHSIQGRWISPDPAGIDAADPTNPQSWNRYGYAVNDAPALTDPLGLDTTAYQWIGACLYESDATSSITASIGPGGQPVYTQDVVWGPWTPVWCAGGSASGGASGGGTSTSGTVKGTSNGPCLKSVGNFVNAHLADSQTLASGLGNGVAPAEVLAVAANETGYGAASRRSGTSLACTASGLRGPTTRPRIKRRLQCSLCKMGSCSRASNS